jgi:hypothetical protein
MPPAARSPEPGDQPAPVAEEPSREAPRDPINKPLGEPAYYEPPEEDFE